MGGNSIGLDIAEFLIQLPYFKASRERSRMSRQCKTHFVAIRSDRGLSVERPTSDATTPPVIVKRVVTTIAGPTTTCAKSCRNEVQEAEISKPENLGTSLPPHTCIP